MDQLIDLVAAKTGIERDRAEQAVTVVIGFIKQRLPESLHGPLDSALSGDGAGGALGSVDGAMGALGGLFGKK